MIAECERADARDKGADQNSNESPLLRHRVRAVVRRRRRRTGVRPRGTPCQAAEPARESRARGQQITHRQVISCISVK